MKDRTQKGCLIKAWKKIAKRLDKRHTTSGFGHPRLSMVQPLSGLRRLSASGLGHPRLSMVQPLSGLRLRLAHRIPISFPWTKWAVRTAYPDASLISPVARSPRCESACSVAGHIWPAPWASDKYYFIFII